ncbi:MAG: DNA-protecting protein DprA, partial [Comamonas sp.]|nr:DNA-protecting protein DprA [Comamonas sp.]
MEQGELAAWLRLTTAPGIGPTAARRLLARFGLPQALFEHRADDWHDCLSPVQWRALQDHRGDALNAHIERTRQWLGASPGAG